MNCTSIEREIILLYFGKRLSIEIDGKPSVQMDNAYWGMKSHKPGDPKYWTKHWTMDPVIMKNMSEALLSDIPLIRARAEYLSRRINDKCGQPD